MPETPAISRWLTQQSLADYLGCSIRQIQIITKEGSLPVSYRLGPRLPRYNAADVDAAMREQGEQNQQPRLIG